MRLHIELDDDLVGKVDAAAGHRGRSAFVRSAVEKALAEQRRLESLEKGFGSIKDTGHEWDEDPAGWVRRQRFADSQRIG